MALRRSEEIVGATRRFHCMTDAEIYDEASDVDAESGSVVVKGPDGVDVRLTPRAAEDTSERLLEGAMKARGQQYFDDPDG